MQQYYHHNDHDLRVTVIQISRKVMNTYQIVTTDCSSMNNILSAADLLLQKQLICCEQLLLLIYCYVQVTRRNALLQVFSAFVISILCSCLQVMGPDPVEDVEGAT
ncbi:hypothetical protein QVD17_38089 [Tagetes erecta]|uniref:Uncharacterized protein n=1 Tax=Tagetes erecta TaxID=13708 RepID=A0AAD8JXH8_TARER|nr:hypothetical protein QVD17_38089 [Tagetes erecta]